MFDRQSLDTFRWMFPGAARNSAEAKPFLDALYQRTKIDLAPFELGDEYIGWQAYGNILSSIRGADVAIIDLMFAFSMATREANNASFNTIAAIASGIILVQSNDGRFDEQLAFLQDFNERYPGNLFAITSLVKCRVSRGEVEHAEYLVRNALGSCSSFEIARDFVYWSYALGNQDEILDKFATLRRNYPTLWQNSGLSTPLRVLQGIEKYGRPEIRKDVSPVYCVNLPNDIGRWRRVEAAFGKLNLRLSRIDGVRADHLPMALRDLFAPRPAEAGQVGCFLAHMKAWETSISRNDSRALIIEDDSLPMFKFSLASILDRMPEDADVVFVNLRSNPIWRASSLETSPLEIAYVPIEKIDPSCYIETNSIGTDGYFISARGAKKLIALAMHTKLHFHVDWQILMACLRTPFSNKVIPAPRFAQFDGEVAKVGHLNGYILEMPIIQELVLDYSPRRILST